MERFGFAGGMLGMETDDVRIRDSYRLADEAGLRYQFVPADLGDGYHANTAKFVMTTASGETKTVVGCSVGGGKVLITELDGFSGGNRRDVSNHY